MFKFKSISDLFILLILFFVALWWGKEHNLLPGRAEPIKTLPVAEGVTDPARLEAHRRVAALFTEIRGDVPIRSICARNDADRYAVDLVIPSKSSLAIGYFKDIKIAAVIELYRYVNDEQPLTYLDTSNPRSSTIPHRKTTVGQFAWCAIHELLAPPEALGPLDAESQQVPFLFAHADVLNLPIERFRQLVKEQLDPWYQRCIDEEALVFRCGEGEVSALVEYPPEE